MGPDFLSALKAEVLAGVPVFPGEGRGRVGAAGVRSVGASGRAPGAAGSALSRAGFLSSFGSDTHYPSVRRNS
ncbi:hypothetical protein DFR70_104332 [Nocardia tenerifensis]|uniref:Uncharacterized protein n=1 Tax=Nocardia tenerifensis TaxID=228006 RepID=A0A318K2J5_9NOCA|nr:hypothetical protein DFR70_104332 [Nocardia tenerifensis]